MCLLENPHFTAAGIAYNKAEYDRFVSGTNGRRTEWYMVPIAALNEQAGIYPDDIKLLLGE